MTKDRGSSVDPEEYSALSNFLRGYLHQDAAVEYHSPVAAAHAFRRDADERETTIVRSELDRLLSQTTGLSGDELLRILEADLGCRWHFRSRAEVEQLRDALK